MGSVVVQCTQCQSKFRIADDKVTERGVRVRCTSCKTVFQVKKPGSHSTEPAPGPGSTMELPALDQGALNRPAPRAATIPPRGTSLPPRPPAPGTPRPAATPPVAARPTRPPPPAARPAPTAVARAPAAPATNGARRLQADDLFGMAELTGDLPPLSPAPSAPPPAGRPPPPRPAPARPAAPSRPAPATSKPPPKPMPSFDDIDLEVADEPATPAPPPAKPGARVSRPPPPLVTPGEAAHAGGPVPLPSPAEGAAPPPPEAEDPASAAKLGAFKTSLRDPFEGMNLGEGAGGDAVELAAARPAPAESAHTEAPPAADAAPAAGEETTVEPAQPPYSPYRELVSAALTGLVGAALAIAVVLAAALGGDGSGGWLGLSTGSDLVATRVVSGLYDTASGKPVFFVRGRVENRSKRQHGPVRVVAELVAEAGSEAHAEAIAGAEPTPEEIFALGSVAEAQKLTRTLETAEGDRRLPPGASLPFFAVIADPPRDLERHKLRVRLEAVDAWTPPSKSAKGH